MKKIIALLLAFSMLFALAACDSGTQNDSSSEAEEPAERSGFMSTISDEALEQAKAMPDAAYDSIPLWCGQTVIPPEWDADCCVSGNFKYKEELITLYAELGFNFVRCPLRFFDLFSEKGGYVPSAGAFAELDRLLEYCAENGIHVCFDLHFCPGFSTDGDDDNDILFTDAASQEAFLLFWSTMASYFRAVPSNLVSFNLLNEPHSQTGTTLDEETYVGLMKRAIAAIRAESPDRLIIVSGIGTSWTEPLYSLVPEKVAQGCSNYLLENGTSQWPLCSINKNLDASTGDLTLKGDFPSGTKITFAPMQYCGNNYKIYADDELICAFDVNGEVFDETGLTVVSGSAELGWWGEGYIYGWHIVSVSTAKSCGTIRIVSSSDYYEVHSLTVETPSQSYQLTGNDSFFTSTQMPCLTFNADGTISAEQEDTLFVMDNASVDALIRRYADFAKETGTVYIALEAGFSPSIDEETALAACGAFAASAEKYGMSWAF